MRSLLSVLSLLVLAGLAQAHGARAARVIVPQQAPLYNQGCGQPALQQAPVYYQQPPVVLQQPPVVFQQPPVYYSQPPVVLQQPPVYYSRGFIPGRAFFPGRGLIGAAPIGGGGFNLNIGDNNQSPRFRR